MTELVRLVLLSFITLHSFCCVRFSSPDLPQISFTLAYNTLKPFTRFVEGREYGDTTVRRIVTVEWTLCRMDILPNVVGETTGVENLCADTVAV